MGIADEAQAQADADVLRRALGAVAGTPEGAEVARRLLPAWRSMKGDSWTRNSDEEEDFLRMLEE